MYGIRRKSFVFKTWKISEVFTNAYYLVLKVDVTLGSYLSPRVGDGSADNNEQKCADTELPGSQHLIVTLEIGTAIVPIEQMRETESGNLAKVTQLVRGIVVLNNRTPKSIFFNYYTTVSLTLSFPFVNLPPLCPSSPFPPDSLYFFLFLPLPEFPLALFLPLLLFCLCFPFPDFVLSFMVFVFPLLSVYVSFSFNWLSYYTFVGVPLSSMSWVCLFLLCP